MSDPFWTDEQIDNIAAAGGEAFLAAVQLRMMKRRIEELERDNDLLEARLASAYERYEKLLLPEELVERRKLLLSDFGYSADSDWIIEARDFLRDLATIDGEEK